MSYQEVLNYLFSQLPMYQRQGKVAFKKDLTNTLKLCEILDNPHLKFRSIHLSGTNGKGSTSHMLAAALQSNGFKTGLYTSPHLKDFRERIKIDGKPISKRAVAQFVEKHKTLFDEIQPSFFEWTVALAFHQFTKAKVDIAIVETGLGGRLDSTNVITPLISVITNIGYDHMEFLGNSLTQIAGEKAGIIKQNVPVIIGRTQKETKPVFEAKAKSLNAKLIFSDTKPNNKLKTDLKGGYQKENLNTAYATLKFLKKEGILSIDLKKATEGLKNVVRLTEMKGRWQQLSNSPKIIVDVGHNEEGINWVLKNLAKEKYNNLHFILGMVNDKEHYKILKPLPKNATYYFCKPNIPRGLEVNLLHAKAMAAGLNGKGYASVKSALNAAKRMAQKQDLIFVGGSTFVVAEVV